MHLLTLQILAISTSLLAWLSISSSCFISVCPHNRKSNTITLTNSILTILWVINTYILYKVFFLCQNSPALEVLTVSYIFEITYNIATALLGGYIIWNRYLSPKLKRRFNLSFPNMTDMPTTISAMAMKVAELDEKKKKKIYSLLNNPEIYKSKITLKMIAKDISIDPAVLSLFIKQELGVSFSEHINSLRLDNARSSLLDKRQEHKTMAELSEDIGYQSISSFYRNFIEYHNLSPLKWKEQTTATTDKNKNS